MSQGKTLYFFIKLDKIITLLVNIKPSREHLLFILNPNPYFTNQKNPSIKGLAFLFQDNCRNHPGLGCFVEGKIEDSLNLKNFKRFEQKFLTMLNFSCEQY